MLLTPKLRLMRIHLSNYKAVAPFLYSLQAMHLQLIAVGVFFVYEKNTLA